MNLVIALPDLALRLSRPLKGQGQTVYALRVETGSDLRREVYQVQPDILLLDWRMGGNRWRAVDEVTAIVERTLAHPIVIALLPRTSKSIEREAAARGCYDVVTVDAVDFEQQVADAMDSALEERLLHPPELRRVSRAALH